ncbi:MAG TPA: glycerophosphodiester phosphodiesterase family protein [Polyangiales bacterium]|jgi:glycerophosphoryl diester phosphodiesterase|nr:glycerophosphodiester phosphodiesterase family protein [Polyangiales bacterium]
MSGVTHVRARGARPWVYGHRGMRGAPENTLPAFERALAAGADGVELDVRVCKSGEVVVMHDADLRRMAGLADRVAELDWTTLSRVDLGGGAHVPLLSQVLERVLPLGKRVNVEIKGDVPTLEPVVSGVAREIAARPEAERAAILVSSFSAEALMLLRKIDAQTAIGFLFDSAREEANAPRVAAANGGAVYGEHPKHSLLDASSLARLRARAQFVSTWTVNDPLRARELAALGVDAIISDLPDVILAALNA